MVKSNSPQKRLDVSGLSLSLSRGFTKINTITLVNIEQLEVASCSLTLIHFTL